MVTSANAPALEAAPVALEQAPANPFERLQGELEHLVGSVEDAELDRLFQAGTELAALGERSRAVDVFRFVALADPGRAEAWQALGACHEAANDLEGAAQLYELGWLLCESDPTLGLHAARVQALRGCADEAEALLESVLEQPLDELHERAAAAVRRCIGGGGS